VLAGGKDGEGERPGAVCKELVMTVKWLIKQLQEANPKDEVILVVEDVGMRQFSSGILSKVIRDGEGAERGKCEIYAKG
jgi:hypothetical protein